MIEIERNLYLKKFIDRMGNNLIKIVTGIRRCGKSYLMNEIFYKYLISNGVSESHIIKFAFDSVDDLKLIEENPIEIFEKNKKIDPIKFINYINSLIKDDGIYYLLLDEIQLLGAFEAVLNGFLRRGNLDIYVSGSNSKFLSTDIITEFSGRGDEIHILPLSFSEFIKYYKANSINKDQPTDVIYDEYCLYGGLPQVVLMPSDEQKVNALKNNMINLYIKDIVRRNKLKTDNNIKELTDILASGISTLINPKRLSDTFKSVKKVDISQQTISNYITFLQEAFIISKVNRYDVKGKRYIETPFKIYFEDLGLRNVWLNFRQIEPTHIMENVIYNELRYRGFNVDVGVSEERLEDKSGNDIHKQLEIDFVANLGNKRYYIQSAYEIFGDEKWDQECRALDKINDSFKKIIIVGRNMKPQRSDKGYLTISIQDFLLNPYSLDL